MKKIALMIITLCLSIGISVSAEATMKIALRGEVKAAKDIGNGKGITFLLPDDNNENFYISAIELAVFEKLDGDNEYHIYTDNNGKESKKKLIHNPESLNIQVDFGKESDYRDKAKYKIAYRYYLTCLHDESIIMIAGKEEKDGWRLVGEDDGTLSTVAGFNFYKNSNPSFKIESFSYTTHSSNGNTIAICNENKVSDTSFPLDLFRNGLRVNISAEDFDKEDILLGEYKLYDADTNRLISEGYLPSNNTINADVGEGSRIKLSMRVVDNYEGSSETKEYIFKLDKIPAFVADEFDDKGYWLKGKKLFSDFYINDDNGQVMVNGEVKATIIFEGDEYDTVMLENIKDGVYRLSKENMPDGEYTINLSIYDKAGNESTHTFRQKLDNTPPDAAFLSPQEYVNSTLYSTWMNVSKELAFYVKDSRSGVKKFQISLDGVSQYIQNLETPVSQDRIIWAVTESKTGKLEYRVKVIDNAREIDIDNNTVKTGNGNVTTCSEFVWLDKTKPTITADYSENTWYEAPYVLTADFNDYSSANSVQDASGIKDRLYSVSNEEVLPTEWNTYTDGVRINTGGVWYVYLKAVDNAGNETVELFKLKINNKSQIEEIVEPTEDYRHTICYSQPQFYVVKNTSYNTKYHFGLSDEDVNDSIETKVKLVSRDDNNKYSESKVVTASTGEILRDIVFNMSYVDSEGDELPDGLYDMYLTVTEVKTDADKVKTYNNVKVCEVVIKRNSPPTPVIEVADGEVTIRYPEETLSGSLNTDKVKDLYKREYKAVIEGDAASNIYRTYTGAFRAKRMVVTALYTDIAGNTSTATKRIYGDDDDDGGGSIATDGDTVTVEESRSGNVYYIGTRRETTNGIDVSIFGYLTE